MADTAARRAAVPPPAVPGMLDTAAEPAARLADRLRALAMAGAVLQLGAHPDDEESGVLALLARGQGVRTVYWSATRGEGGQNKRGPERGDALGVLRTWESLDARTVDGAEVLYGPFIDFGFSKSGEDALRRWGRDLVVREIVRAIRLVQPFVVIGRWSGTASDGHGHHQAIGLVTPEAVDAAADPSAFPELGLPPWRVGKLYRSLAHDWQPGEDAEWGVAVRAHEEAGHLRVDTGAIEPVSGLSFQELAALSINRHFSQGLGFAPEPGSYYHYYARERPETGGRETSFLDGIDPTLSGLADRVEGPPELRDLLAGVVTLARTALDAYHPHAPAAAVPPLLEAAAALRPLLTEAADPALAFALAQRLAAIEQAATIALGLRLECLVESARVTPGRRLSVRAGVLAAHPIEVDRLELELPAGWSAKRTGDGTWDVSVPEDAPPRAPYWLRAPHGPYRYTWPDDGPDLSYPLDAPLVGAVAHVRTGEHGLTLRAPAVERSGFPGGARALPVTVVPRLALAPRQRREIVAGGDERTVLECDVLVQEIEPGASGRLTLHAPEGWAVEPAGVDLPGPSSHVRFRVTVPAHALAGAYELRYAIEGEGSAGGLELRPVRLAAPGAPGAVDEHSCIAEAHLVRPAHTAVDVVDVRFVRTLRYGYVRGMDEEIPEVLAALGLDLVEVSDDDLRYADLRAYDALVVGPRAYDLRHEVRRQARRLLDYVADGGTLIVQFQGYGYDEPGLAPHPFRINQPHGRVTDPAAPVEPLDAAHPVLQTPNPLTPADFDGWVHDRGMYFFGTWDRRYSPVLATHDEGEEPLAGGLVVAAHGRGTYVYTGLSFFRQIPAGVPGAIRLFANLLGLAEARVRDRMAHLRGLELFGFMDDEQLYAAARIVSERWVDAGQLLAREGDPGRELFVLVDGEVEVVKGGRLLHRARPGEALGELSLLAGIPRTADMRAASDAVVLVLRADVFDAWLLGHPVLARRMLELLARKIAARDAAS